MHEQPDQAKVISKMDYVQIEMKESHLLHDDSHQVAEHHIGRNRPPSNLLPVSLLVTQSEGTPPIPE